MTLVTLKHDLNVVIILANVWAYFHVDHYKSTAFLHKSRLEYTYPYLGNANHFQYHCYHNNIGDLKWF